MMRHVRHPCWIFCYPTLELYNVLNATCVLVGHNLLDLLEYTHTVGVVDNLFLFCPTLSTGLKIRVRLFSLRLRTVGDYNVHCSNTIWLPQSTLFACMTWGFWTGNLLKLYLYTVSSFYYYYYILLLLLLLLLLFIEILKPCGTLSQLVQTRARKGHLFWRAFGKDVWPFDSEWSHKLRPFAHLPKYTLFVPKIIGNQGVL